MKSLVMTVVREFKLIFRDGISLYMVVAPAFLAVVFILIFGSVREASVSFAVDNSVPDAVIARLEQVADIEVKDDHDALLLRVRASDNIAGIYMKDGEPTVLVEGNEGEEFEEGIRYLVGAALRGDPIEYEPEKVEAKPDATYALSMAGVFLLAMFIGGATPGLGGVNERESGVIRAIAVSPMTLFGYVGSKIIPAILLGLVGVTSASIIIGRADAIPWFMLLVLCGVFVSGITIFLLISFADNQVAAIGVLKLLMPLLLAIGMVSYFVPGRWIYPFYVLPMYWQFEAVRAIILDRSSLRESLMVLATGLPWFMIVMLLFMKRVRMKASAWNVFKKAA